MTSLLTIGPLYKTGIVKRPSAIVKSPYVADIHIHGEDTLAHTASLGCNGHVETGSNVYVLDTQSPQNKCRYRVCLSEFISGENAVIIGTNPKYAEVMAEQMLLQNKINILQNIRSYTREFTLCLPEYELDSRFDFSGIDSNGTPFIMEIKTVPLADYEDILPKERTKKLKNNPNIYSEMQFHEKVAYFPDGYRKSMNDPVSPRALKHVQELQRIKQMSKTRCILCFIIQRDDVSSFSPSHVDLEYRSAVLDAISGGVEVIAAVIRWEVNAYTGIGNAVFVKNVPVV
jgi:DNA-binding sugar fermentation-stimulating protein